ncbi:MAG: signal recognition particle protein [Bacteroidales bacterium]
MFENLSEKLDKAFKVLKGQGKISEINVAETLKEVRKALLDADVNFKIAKQFTDDVKTKALGMNVLTSVSPGQMMVKLVHDELTQLMGNTQEELDLKSNPTVILMAGLQGSGKTTHSAKLAYFLKNKKAKKVLMVACDVYRPAAIQQLQVLGEQIGVEVFANLQENNPVNIAQQALKYAKEKAFNVVIVDTAGRLAVDKEMMDEISRIKAAIQPQETLFVVDSMTGQDAVNTAKAFYDLLQFQGVILTKLDGDTRGGAALTIRSVVSVPIKFVGIGEKMEALDIFYPSRMADRILGMGDIVSLVEKAQEQFDEVQAKRLQKKFHTNDFNFDDFYAQIQQIKKMGNIKDLMGMIPGMGKMIKDVDIQDDAFKYVEAMIQSMTPKERQNPTLLNINRRKRIALGSGVEIGEVNKLVKQLDDTKKVMKQMSGSRGAQMMQAMSKMKK